MAKYLKKNFFPEYKKYLKFLEKDYKNKLEPTNNKLENYNDNTMLKYKKGYYRIMWGYGALMHKKDDWIKRRNQDLTN